MKTKLEQAARQIIVDWDSGIHLYEAITALREALAEQAEQEPVAGLDEDGFPWKYNLDGKDWVPLYAAPVRTKDLTDAEIMKINFDTASIVPTCDRQFHFARAVIAADREKNRA